MRDLDTDNAANAFKFLKDVLIANPYAVVLELNEIKQQQSLLAATRASKYSDDDIRVNFFGGMEIIGPKGTLTGDDIKTEQGYLLLAYLLLNHKRTVPLDQLVALSEEIADVIFDDMAPFVEQVKNILAK